MKKKVSSFIKKYHPDKYLLYLYLFTPLLLFSLNNELGVDNDRFFLFNIGRYILNNGIPYNEPFTMFYNFKFIGQQWLSSIIFYSIYDTFGYLGLILLLILCLYVSTYIVYKLCMMLSNKRMSLSIIITVWFSCLYSSLFLRTRPHIFDFIIFLLELYLLEKYAKENKIRYLLIFPILSLLLSNLHASCSLMFIIYMIPYIIRINSKYLYSDNYKILPIVIIMILSFLTLYINPYGADSIKYLFNSYGIKEINYFVGEMNPLNIYIGKLIIISLIIPVIVLYISKGKKKIKLRYLLLYLGTFYLSLSHFKGFQYFMIGALFPNAYYLKDYFLKYEERTYSIKYKKYTNIIYAIFGLFIIFNILTNIEFKTNFSNYYIDEIRLYLDNLNLDKSRLKVYTEYDVGGYLEYYGYKCFMDPRAEVFLKANNGVEDILTEYYRFESNSINYVDFLDKYKFDYIVVAEDKSLFINYLNTSFNTKYRFIMKEENDSDLYQTSFYLYELIK